MIDHQMSEADYHAHPAIRASYLKKVYEQSIWHADRGWNGSSQALLIGSATHAILAGDEDTLTVMPSREDSGAVHTQAEMKAALKEAGQTGYSSWASDALRDACRAREIPLWSDIEAAWKKENEGKLVLTTDELAYAQALAAAAQTKVAQALTGDEVPLSLLLEMGHPEVSIITNDPTTGLEIKVRPDRLIELPAGWIILSWKTVREGNASPGEYARAYRYQHYDLADAMYIDAIEAATGKPVLAVLNVVIEKLGESGLDASAPSPEAVAIYETAVTDEVIERGRRKYRAALLSIAEYRASENTQAPGYSHVAQPIYF